MKELTWQRQVIQHLKKTYKPCTILNLEPAGTVGAGWPDLLVFIIKDGFPYKAWIELKIPPYKPTDIQLTRINNLREYGEMANVFNYSEDWKERLDPDHLESPFRPQPLPKFKTPWKD